MPLVLGGRVGNRRRVTAACATAQELGLSVGMPVSKAQALVPGLQVLSHDAHADAASLERLAPADYRLTLWPSSEGSDRDSSTPDRTSAKGKPSREKPTAPIMPPATNTPTS